MDLRKLHDSSGRSQRTFEIRLPGDPIAKARPKFVSRDRKGNPLPFVRTYDVQHTLKKKLREYVQWFLKKNHPGFKPFEGAIAVEMTFFMKIPVSWPKFKKEIVLGDHMVIWHEIKPDGTNLYKFPEDCLNEILWNDDGQVASFFGHKLYSDAPETVIKILQLPEPDWAYWKAHFAKLRRKC